MNGNADPAAQPLLFTNHRLPIQSYTEESVAGPKTHEEGSTHGENVGEKLAKRKKQFARRRIIADAALGVAMFGICLMIVETELTMANVYGKEEIASSVVKLFITMSTVNLLCLIVWYHAIEIKLVMIDNCLDDCRLAISISRVFQIIMELAICVIHPFPGNHEFDWTPAKSVSLDPFLSIPMFLRLYLVCRVLRLHSHLFSDARSQSLGALNRISFNFSYVFKSLMRLYPAYVLAIIIVAFILMASWSMRVCELHLNTIRRNYLLSIWVITVSILSGGYGSIVPASFCGRGISVLTGMFGSGVTALLIAVLAQKLEFTRSEECVHNFVLGVELEKKHKQTAANILREGWKVYTCKRDKRSGGVLRTHQRKLMDAIKSARKLKAEQRLLADNGIDLVEIATLQTTISERIEAIEDRQTNMEEQVSEMRDALRAIDTKLENIGHLLANKL